MKKSVYFHDRNGYAFCFSVHAIYTVVETHTRAGLRRKIDCVVDIRQAATPSPRWRRQRRSRARLHYRKIFNTEQRNRGIRMRLVVFLAQKARNWTKNIYIYEFDSLNRVDHTAIQMFL